MSSYPQSKEMTGSATPIPRNSLVSFTSLSVSLSLSLSLCLSRNPDPSIHLSIYIHQSVYLSIYPSILLSMCLSIHLFVHLSIRRRNEGRTKQALLPPTIESLHDGNEKTEKDPDRMPFPGRRNALAQDGKDEASIGQRQSKGLQENPRPLHQFRQEQKGGEDQLGNAPVPFRATGRGKRRRARSVEDLLSDATKAV